jgi:hypothetical protein
MTDAEFQTRFLKIITAAMAPKKERLEQPGTHPLRCPRCDAMAFNLWQIYGVSYFKCDACGHKTNNL